MGETIKAARRRLAMGFFDKFCCGQGIDIGAGNEPLLPTITQWDKPNGDATFMAGIADQMFDYVYSSHCLEHLEQPKTAVTNWFRILKPLGYLILVVPHRDLYEKRKELPSRWNNEHKWFFLPEHDEAPCTLGLLPLVQGALSPHYRLVYLWVCSDNLTMTDPDIHSDGEYSIELVIQKHELPCCNTV